MTFIVTRTKNFRPDEPYSLVTDEELKCLRYVTYHALERGEERGALSLLKQYVNSDPEHIRSWCPAWVIVKQASRVQGEEADDAEAVKAQELDLPPEEEPTGTILSWWTTVSEEEGGSDTPPALPKAKTQAKAVVSKRSQRFIYFFFWGWVVTCRGRIITVIPWSCRKKERKRFKKWCKKQAQRQADVLSGVHRTLFLDGGGEEEEEEYDEEYDDWSDWERYFIGGESDAEEKPALRV
jgi:hypothetical protein